MTTTHQVPFKDHGTIEVWISDGKHEFNADGWECTTYSVRVSYFSRRLSTSYSQGMAWPVNLVNPKDVLRSLVSDYDSGRWDAFEGWAEDYGYDPDSRKAYAIYESLEKQRTRIDRVFGSAVEAFLDQFSEEND